MRSEVIYSKHIPTHHQQRIENTKLFVCTTFITILHQNIMICEGCKEFFHWLQEPKKEPDTSFWPHNHTWKGWDDAIRDGCVFCIYIRTKILEENHPEIDYFNKYHQTTFIWTTRKYGLPQLLFGNESKRVSYRGYEDFEILHKIEAGKGGNLPICHIVRN